ncbi:hypothetical protein HGRIS_008647 [Hohenbuehelia grisea]|uniref:HMG box domain-containing protein n=1 Tax=Hohenbuehelia grisea TaxID=104357 RepID=A0ABR3J8I3_9AGAR
MPAERTRGSRRSDADGTQLVWTTPAQPVPPTGITFATNITPCTFNDQLPPLVEAPPYYHEAVLFPPSEDSTSSRRPAHSKKKSENHIPRPPNAFILFRSSFIKQQHVTTEVETNHSTLSKIIGITWRELPEQERQIWHNKARMALDEHKRKFPQYAFRPSHFKGKGGSDKRKVREVGPKDLKRCTKIAELLVEGKKGPELHAAILEFDKTHVPEVVTRFEAPITERAYRRSSSAPIPDSESNRSFLPKSPILSSIRRAASSQPTRESSPVPMGSDFEGLPLELSTSQPYAPFAAEEDSFATFASPSQQESTFPGFDSFSFDSVATPFAPIECDPLSAAPSPPPPMSAPANLDCLFPELPTVPSRTGRGLSIDTSFLTAFVQSPSPGPASDASCSPPSSPDFLNSPSPTLGTPYSPSFDFDVLGQKTMSSFDDGFLTQPLDAFSEKGQYQFYVDDNAFPPVDMSGPQIYTPTPSPPCNFDFSFSAYSVPQYAS